MQTKLISDQEVQQYRAETKGTKERIHFNNAGSSLPPDVVVDTVISYLKEEAIYGGYETEAKYSQQLNNTHSLIARLINTDEGEIALVENASSAWGIAFNGIDFKPGDGVIISEMEYVTNLIGYLNAEKTHGIKTKIVYNDEHGNFDLQGLKNAITAKTKLIAVTHIASTTGGMIPVVEIGKIARKYNILYLVDACQSVGQVPVDVKEIDCDMLSVTGRKYLRAPRGTGFLYVRKQILDKIKLSFIDGFAVKSVSLDEFKLKDDARRFELYEKNRAITLGLSKAVEYALNIGIDRIWQRIQQLATLMRRQLNHIDGITVHDIGDQQCGIVTFSVSGFEAPAIKAKLAEKQINVSVGQAHSTLIFMNKHHLTSVVRASVHYYNTEEEILLLCNELGLLLKTVIA
ncbi:aminotransferase class V-fold PLP-dependent enzyme [Mucilaginibacter sp. X4EP1]|uniref:aminotransferase class V-fold PLP-dependent enzyme n=1 Tax=Mucilaginibacter sp. X4EP1 TaxID=2723092 RepID=UPI0021678E8E|nr:aminotransferase class V-fold PLP-dependent enzyme [Mucilaginibacter sp. X4EP1]MCS3814697.1 selenocysteine lyase/cysteine desulfurase [Mucilaginibacter sp. X4EP1]